MLQWIPVNSFLIVLKKQSKETGWASPVSSSKEIVIWDGSCKKITSTLPWQYYIPTYNKSDWDTFVLHTPSGITISECPINCVGSWSDTSTCSKTCWGGVKRQIYSITTVAKNGWDVCLFTSGATRWWSTSCNTGACCSPNGSCTASAPACETTTYGVDNCWTSCSRTGGTCCTSHDSYSCDGTNIVWYDSCGVAEGIRSACSYGCSGKSCIAECVISRITVTGKFSSSYCSNSYPSAPNCPEGYTSIRTNPLGSPEPCGCSSGKPRADIGLGLGCKFGEERICVKYGACK